MPDADASSLVPPPLPARGLPRPTSRRSLRSLSSSDAQGDPLSTPPSTDAVAAGAKQYAVYSPVKKRTSLSGTGTGSGASSPGGGAAPSTALSPSEGPLSPVVAASSSMTTPPPPFHPTLSPNLPPLVSRTSNSSLPSPSGRTYGRSVSEAKEQLQKQALKAELQGLGLANESLGAAFVHKLAGLVEEPEWKGVMAALGTGKVTLLLPADKSDSAAQLPPATLLDHLILLDPPVPSTSNSKLPPTQGFVTLSGLKGVLTSDELVFTSCGIAVRETEEGAVRPGPLSPTPDYASEDLHRYLRGPAPPSPLPRGSVYPSTILVSAISSLSVPRSAFASTSSTPLTQGRSSASSRLAALFSKAAPADTASPDSSSPAAPAISISESTSSADSATEPSTSSSSSSSRLPNLELSVLAVGKAVRFAEMAKSIAVAVEAHLRSTLDRVEGLKGDTVSLARLCGFATRLQPPPSWGSAFSTSSSVTPADSLFSSGIDDVSDAFQDALHSTRLDLARNLSAASPHTPAGDAAPVPSPTLEDCSTLEERVDRSLEAVEEALVSTLYDRLFAPPSSGDGQDDENLASRIAALNVLELSLEHLGVDLDEEDGPDGWDAQSRGIRESLEDLAVLVGKELERLEDPADRSPSSKLAVFVDVHKILVDELSKLPPVPLKKDIGSDNSLSSDRPAEVEMDDAASRTSSRAPSRPRSPPPPAVDDDELLKTPRPPPVADQDVPEINLSASAAQVNELSSSMHEATSSSMFGTMQAPSPPPSIFETSSRRSPSISSGTATSSADLILPLLIYSVVRANPPHLVSHLKFAHRFRSESLMRGQASYCATNFDAVVEFLNHVDLASLGLSSQKVLAATPSPSSLVAAGARPRAHTTGRIRGRVTNELDNLVDTANSALVGVVDSSYRMLFGPKGLSSFGGVAPRSLDEVKSVLEGAKGKARNSLPFRRSASVAALSVEARRREAEAAAARGTSSEVDGGGAAASEGGATREMVDIVPSAPGGTPDVPPDDYAPVPTVTSVPVVEPTKKDKDDDARSVRSISSLLKETALVRTLGEMREGVAGGGGGGSGGSTEDRPSLGERLSSIPVLGRFGGDGKAMMTGGGGGAGAAGSARPSSLFTAFSPSASPASSRRATLLNPLVPPSPSLTPPTAPPRNVQPVQKFLACASAAELRLGDVQELLDEYKRLAAAWGAEGAAGGRKDGMGKGEAP
ncbi:SPOSA6832_02914 [Sporobolomyces salmonicolor]|uniref:SPOSA6832_02914-mRNA-1:cds n=1 Tax=Sporidiobolus salmonicolor TaxID=5005 RepID=A0A0D6ENS3_SPOSA|nr:SPOSA6832_02914 [Sporobolomyces salmonicolor]